MVKCIDEVFVKPEKPFLVIYTTDNNISYAWFESIDEIDDLVKELNEWHKDKWEIEDIIEIGSYRELELE